MPKKTKRSLNRDEEDEDPKAFDFKHDEKQRRRNRRKEKNQYDRVEVDFADEFEWDELPEEFRTL